MAVVECLSTIFCCLADMMGNIIPNMLLKAMNIPEMIQIKDCKTWMAWTKLILHSTAADNS